MKNDTRPWYSQITLNKIFSLNVWKQPCSPRFEWKKKTRLVKGATLKYSLHLRLLYIIADLVTHPLPLAVQIIAMFLCHNTVIHSGVLNICNIIYKCLEEKVGQQYYQYQPLISNNRTHTHARTHRRRWKSRYCLATHTNVLQNGHPWV
jgi:hypothetical protein